MVLFAVGWIGTQLLKGAVSLHVPLPLWAQVRVFWVKLGLPRAARGR